MSGIVAVFVDLVRRGLKTIDEVPESIREEVRKIIETGGLNG